jgi:insulysin
MVFAEDLLEKIPEEEFLEHKKGLRGKRLEKPKKLLSFGKKFWDEIVLNEYRFERDEEEVAELEKLTKEDLLEFFRTHLKLGAPKRRKLSVGILSNKAKDTSSLEKENEVLIDTDIVAKKKQEEELSSKQHKATEILDIAAFKAGRKLFPPTKPSMELEPPKSSL